VSELPATMLAPAKLNLCLYVGGVREDGLHEICSIFVPLDLADERRQGVGKPRRAVVRAQHHRDLSGWWAR